jgi:Pyruvate/2-oxoacid:ferredoxin oxidoreductase delta subunit
MSTARFHVFSGTGNGRYIARQLAERLGARGFGVEILEVSAALIARLKEGKGEARDLEARDLEAFVFPVYAMAVPRIMERYMKALGRARLRGGARPRVALLSVNGRISDRVRDGHEGQALAQAERVLRRRGWDVAYRETFDYPQNMTNFIPAQNDARRASIMSLMEGRIEAVADDLAAGRSRKRPCHLWALIVGWPFGWLYRIFGRRVFGMVFAADERCDGCGLCAAHCPARAIRMRGARPAWSYACEGCERCFNACPKETIQTSLVRVAVVVALCAGPSLCPLKAVLSAFIGGWPSWIFGSLWFALSAVLGFAILRLLDLGLIALSRIEFLRPVLAFGLTRWTRRYRDPGRGA